MAKQELGISHMVIKNPSVDEAYRILLAQKEHPKRAVTFVWARRGKPIGYEVYDPNRHIVEKPKEYFMRRKLKIIPGEIIIDASPKK